MWAYGPLFPMFVDSDNERHGLSRCDGHNKVPSQGLQPNMPAAELQKGRPAGKPQKSQSRRPQLRAASHFSIFHQSLKFSKGESYDIAIMQNKTFDINKEH